MSAAFGHFRVGFVTGATPDKWARTWRSRYSRDPLELVPLEEAEQEDRLRAGTLDMALVRLPIDRDGLHCIPLYEELPVAVMATEHVLTLAEEVTTADLADEQLVDVHEAVADLAAAVPLLERLIAHVRAIPA